MNNNVSSARLQESTRNNIGSSSQTFSHDTSINTIGNNRQTTKTTAKAIRSSRQSVYSTRVTSLESRYTKLVDTTTSSSSNPTEFRSSQLVDISSTSNPTEFRSSKTTYQQSTTLNIYKNTKTKKLLKIASTAVTAEKNTKKFF